MSTTLGRDGGSQDASRQGILIDTSTIADLRLDDPSGLPNLDRRSAAAIEAMVLFEQIYLDGRTVNSELPPFRWLDELDQGFTFVNLTYAEVQETYNYGMSLARNIVGSRENIATLQSDFGAIPFREMGIPSRYAAGNTVLWNDIHGYVAHSISPEVADLVSDLVREMHIQRPGGAIILARLCYYLALQQRLESLLLLHPSKAYGSEHLTFGYSRTIFDAFDGRVRAAYLKRRREWLGDTPREVSIPPLARFVIGEASKRGWSLGRAISSLRTRPEARLFREGMRELIALVESGNHAGVDSVLAELDRAAHSWSQRLNNKPRSRKLTLQVAIPLLSPSFDVPIPTLRRTTAQKLLVLIDQTMP